MESTAKDAGEKKKIYGRRVSRERGRAKGLLSREEACHYEELGEEMRKPNGEPPSFGMKRRETATAKDTPGPQRNDRKKPKATKLK